MTEEMTYGLLPLVLDGRWNVNMTDDGHGEKRIVSSMTKSVAIPGMESLRLSLYIDMTFVRENGDAIFPEPEPDHFTDRGVIASLSLKCKRGTILRSDDDTISINKKYDVELGTKYSVDNINTAVNDLVNLLQGERVKLAACIRILYGTYLLLKPKYKPGKMHIEILSNEADLNSVSVIGIVQMPGYDLELKIVMSDTEQGQCHFVYASRLDSSLVRDKTVILADETIEPDALERVEMTEAAVREMANGGIIQFYAV